MSGVIERTLARPEPRPDPFGLMDDPALPHLGFALDTPAVAARLARDDDARMAGRTLAGGAIERIQHRAGKLCTVLHRLILRDAAGAEHDEWVVVRTVRSDRTAHSLERALAALGGTRPLATGPLRGAQAIRLWDDHDTVVRLFPHDPGLPALSRAIDADFVRSWIAPEGSAFAAGPAEIVLDRIKYMPEKRCVLRHRVGRSHRAERAETRSVIAKIYPDERSSHLFRAQRSAWEQLRLQPGAPIVPEPLCHLESVNTVCYEDWGGRPLIDRLGEASLEDIVALAAETLAALHRGWIRGLGPPPAPDELREAAIADGAKYVARVPAQRERIAELLDVLEHRRPAAPMIEVPIHGAARLEQMLARAGDVALIDLDALASGDPMLDVAEFVASLQFLCLGAGEHHDFESAAERFLASYAAAVPWHVARDRVAWYGLAFTLTKMYGAVKHLELPVLAALEEDDAGAMSTWTRALAPPARRARRAPASAVALPHLAEAMHPQSARAALERLLRAEHPERELVVDDCRVSGVRLKPGKQCSLTYRVSGRDGSGAPFEQWLHGRMVVDWEREVDRPQNAVADWPGCDFWKPVMLWPEFRMVVRAFPFDPEMPFLARLVDAAHVASVLEPHGIAAARGPDGAPAVACTRVKYRPGKHCVVRYQPGAGAAERRPAAVYCKAYANGDAAYVHAALDHLWRHPATRAGALSIARPIGLAPSMNAILTEAWEGRNVSARAAQVGWEAALSPALIERLAAAIAALHAIDWDGPPLREAPAAAAVLDEAREDAAELPQFFPASGGAAAGAVARLAARAPRSGGPRVPIHGTFKLAQVLCHDERIALVDFDAVAFGDPHSDLGEMFASLLYLEVSDGVSSATVRDRIDGFLATYRSRVPWRCDDARWRWYAAAFLLGKISTSLKTLEVTTERDLEAALALLDRLLDSDPIGGTS